MKVKSSLHSAFSAFICFCTALSLALCALAVYPPQPAHAARTYVVTVTHDRTNDLCDAECTLREAYTKAVAGDSITFAPQLAGRSIFLEQKLTIIKAITIFGPVGLAPVTITTESSISLLTIDSTVTLENLNLSGGFAAVNGGAIYNNGNLKLNRVTISASTANNNLNGQGGGIFNTANGRLEITNSVFSQNVAKGMNGGGAIFNASGTVTVTDSTFYGNNAFSGGGITNISGTLTISGSTFTDNWGGGIHNTGTLTITNSTLSGNEANYSAGIYAPGGSTSVSFSTIHNNLSHDIAYGAGIYTGGTAFLNNTIISGNTTVAISDPTPVLKNCIGAFNGSNNLADDATCGASFYSNGIRLGTLGQNGGNTQTVPLLDGSTAIDAAGGCTTPTDQRGYPRPQGAACDIGAYEYHSLPLLSIGDLARSEGNSGATVFAFTVNLSSTSTTPVSFSISTSDGTAGAGSGDYTPIQSAPYTIPAGSSGVTVEISAAGDALYEADEDFYVTIGAPGNAILGDSQGVATIVNDDAAPTLSVDDIQLTEGGSGIFTATLSTPSGLETRFSVSTAGDTALSGVDFKAIDSTSCSIPAGAIGVQIEVLSIDDSEDEPSETFRVILAAPTHATLADAQGTGTIRDNDGPEILVAPTGALTTTEAGGKAAFTVTLNTQPSAEVSIALSSSDPTEGTISPLSLVFTPANWNVPQTITVTGINDALIDGDQAYTVNLAPAISADPAYDGRIGPAVQIKNLDNEIPGLDRFLWLPFVSR